MYSKYLTYTQHMQQTIQTYAKNARCQTIYKQCTTNIQNTSARYKIVPTIHTTTHTHNIQTYAKNAYETIYQNT